MSIYEATSLYLIDIQFCKWNIFETNRKIVLKSFLFFNSFISLEKNFFAFFYILICKKQFIVPR